MSDPSTASDVLSAPLAFVPVYQTVVWGGRRLEAWRDDLPEGPVGESWELADHDRGMSVVADGPLSGTTLRELTERWGSELVGGGFSGGDFPLMIKLLDANARLSVQVHPDDALAQSLGVGPRGKTECWYFMGDGGELFQGTREGVDRARFEAELAAGQVDETLNRFEASDGDFFFLDARTVHALGTGCLLAEIQQTCDVTFRVWDWGRVGLDGKPRPLHVEQSLETIDFDGGPYGPVEASASPHPQSGTVRPLASCAYFTVEERRGELVVGGDGAACSVIICLDGAGAVVTRGGSRPIGPMQTVLVPAAAGEWHATTTDGELRLLVARPVFDGEAA